MFGDPLDLAFLKTLNVLYVEDDADSRQETAAFLQRRVGSLATAAGGLEALALFAAGPVQVVVTDVQMPGMDGLELALKLRQLDPAVQILITTAFERAEYLSRSIAIGIDQFILKPVHPERLQFALLTCARRLRLAAAGEAVPSAVTEEEGRRLDGLTEREKQVLTCLGRGLPSEEVGLWLGISPKTVNTHLAHIMLKMGVHKSSALAVLAVRAGLTRLPEAWEGQ